MDWMRGYYAHAGYSYGYYQETMPSRLRWAAMLKRHLLPESGFRYLDAGCGQGLNLILAAALHPDSEFVGIDFMADHIAHARKLAARCGLDNVSFIEGDFTELADDPASLGEFDYIVCQGISSWIAPAINDALFRMVSQILKPGGVFHNGYNTQPGWLSVMPFQHLAKLHRGLGATEALNAARRDIEQVGAASDKLFGAYPRLPERIAKMAGQDPAYLAQEYVHESWRPFFVSDMIEALAALKLNFLGSATLTDNFDTVLPAPVRDVIQAQPSVILREQIRDYATMQNFRRDLYVKGKPGAWDVELSETLRTTRVMINPLTARPAPGQPFIITGSTNELAGEYTAYNTLLERIERLGDDAAIGQLIDDESDQRRKTTLLETLSIMLHAGWITPSLPAPNPRGPRICAAIAHDATLGAPYRYLPIPCSGGAIGVQETDLAIVRLLGEGVPREALGAGLVEILAKLQRQLAKDGQPVTDPAEREIVLDAMIADFYATKLPYFVKTGVV